MRAHTYRAITQALDLEKPSLRQESDLFKAFLRDFLVSSLQFPVVFLMERED